MDVGKVAVTRTGLPVVAGFNRVMKSWSPVGEEPPELPKAKRNAVAGVAYPVLTVEPNSPEPEPSPK